MRTFAAVSILMLSAATLVAGDEDVNHHFAASVARAGVRRIVVEIPAGEITIRNNTTNAISVTGEVRRSYNTHHDRVQAQRVVDDISAEIVIRGDEAIVRRHFGPNAHGWSARSFHSDMEVHLDVPPGVDLLLNTNFGEIDIDGSFGNIDADLTAGEIHVRTPRAVARDVHASVRIGEVHANTGDETISKEGVFPGAMHYLNVSGKSDINVHSTFGEVHVTLTR